MKQFDLTGKVALVTGANGQLGSVLCGGLKQFGATVIAVDMSDTVSHEHSDAYFQMDITHQKRVSEVFRRVIEEYGQLDVLINNAGVSTFEPFEDRPEAQFDWVTNVNLKGTFFCIQTYVHMVDEFKLKGGSIINIASIFGLVSPDFRNYTDCDRKNSEVYGATKAGVIQMTKYFAVHLADRGIRVNAVSPGGILNPSNPQGKDFQQNYAFRTPMKRLANAEEMLGGVVYFASDMSSYTTGQNLVIDGGLSAW